MSCASLTSAAVREHPACADRGRLDAEFVAPIPIDRSFSPQHDPELWPWPAAIVRVTSSSEILDFLMDSGRVAVTMPKSSVLL